MFAHWSIRRKLLLCLSLLLFTVCALSVSSYFGVSAFRSLAKSVRLRAGELPLSSMLAQDVSKLNVTYNLYRASLAEHRASLAELQPWQLEASSAQTAQLGLFEVRFEILMTKVSRSFDEYSAQLAENRASDEYRQLQVHEHEQDAVLQFATLLESIRAKQESEFAGTERESDLASGSAGPRVGEYEQDPGSEFSVGLAGDLADDLSKELGDVEFAKELDRLEALANELPEYLHSSMENFADDVRWQYRTLMGVSGVVGAISLVLLLTLGRLFYAWVFRPLEILIHGSRRVAGGDFEHQILLDSHDEIAELARAMNGMTRSFREIRDDLNEKVRQRTKEVVRSEQLASVGFLAAGVAHEINNPLASIAMCAESLEQRVTELVKGCSGDKEQLAVVDEYLGMIQGEAFRCKEITERLLDFSRLGDVEKQRTNLTELTESVIRIIQHLGKYKAKEIVFHCQEPVFAEVSPREIKQVILNLLTNSLDSLGAGGRVTVQLTSERGRARLCVRDNGCGMTDEVLKNLFEPFFTRRRDGQGTGLGMSITYRIVHDHGGEIEPHSDGPGQGSTFVVSLPLMGHDENRIETRRAA